MISFTLTEGLIAQTPAIPRDSARLLTYSRATGQITDAVFADILTYLPAKSTLVVNNSKVEQCRWLFDDGKSEIFVLEKLDSRTIRALVRPGRKFKIGSTTQLTSWLTAQTLAIDSEGIRTIRLNVVHDDLRLRDYEHIPLPPYIAQNDQLKDEYQTVYAKTLGSKAAPTAGLHFTNELMSKISTSHDVAELTLHVGLGTFAKLTDDQLKTGHLHSESYEITAKTAATLNAATHRTAVGTTSVRTLESAYTQNGYVAQKSATSILISPGYIFKAVDALITNFHLPGTSLLLLVEAFVGSESELLKIYKHAITQKYRFYSFGDAMLVI